MRQDFESDPAVAEQMDLYREHRAAMRQAQEIGDEQSEIEHYQAAVRALKAARKLAGIGGEL